MPGRPLSDDPDTELFEPVETNLGKHHKLILETCIRTVLRPYGRALIMMPPGAGKSSYGSVVLPAYLMGKYPGTRVGLGSYGSDIARKMGRRTRSVIRQTRYKAVFPDAELSKESNAGDQFVLLNGSEYMADSLGGQFPGNRFDVALADDPMKGRSEANSEVIRKSTWDEFVDNFMTRLVPRGSLLVIMTHWHEEDPAGHILPDGWDGESGTFKGKHDGLDWEVLCLQAKCENHTDPLGRQLGEYLWPEWFDRQHWQQFERVPSSWNALYQQRPRPPEGAFFLEASLLVDGQPCDWPYKIDLVFAVIDSAIKTGSHHDGTGVTYFGMSLHGQAPSRLVVLDWDLIQIEGGKLEHWLPSVFERLEELCVVCYVMLGSRGAFIEDKGSGTILIQQAKNKGWPAEGIDSKLSSMGKVEKAQNAETYVSAGEVKITRHAYEKTVTYKGTTKNHWRTQVFGFSVDSGDKSADDLLDTFTYGVAISLGNREGF